MASLFPRLSPYNSPAGSPIIPPPLSPYYSFWRDELRRLAATEPSAADRGRCGAAPFAPPTAVGRASRLAEAVPALWRHRAPAHFSPLPLPSEPPEGRRRAARPSDGAGDRASRRHLGQRAAANSERPKLAGRLAKPKAERVAALLGGAGGGEARRRGWGESARARAREERPGCEWPAGRRGPRASGQPSQRLVRRGYGSRSEDVGPEAGEARRFLWGL